MGLFTMHYAFRHSRERSSIIFFAYISVHPSFPYYLCLTNKKPGAFHQCSGL